MNDDYFTGTGKTLMARKIGQMIHAREPKIVNGPGELTMSRDDG